MTIGYFDTSQVVDGDEGLNYYQNLGLGYWAVVMNEIKYDLEDLGSTKYGRLAVLDTANTSI
jgi:hypothetical protein